MSFNLPQGDGKPKCYGISCNPSDPCCAGGADVTYNDNGSHIRPQCDYYGPCRAVVGHKRYEQERAANLIPPASLVRNPTQAQVTVGGQPVPQQMTPAQMHQYVQEQARALAAQMVNQSTQYQQYGRPPATPQVIQGYPMTWDSGFQPMPVNYRMPGFLSTPETVAPGGSIWGKLFREIFRSMGKAGGHSVAHFFDSTPIIWPPNGGNGQ